MDGKDKIQTLLLWNYMNNSDLFDGLEHFVRPNIFTSSINKKSYEIIKAYHSQGKAIDQSILFTSLLKVGIPQKQAADVVGWGIGYVTKQHIKEYVEILFWDYVSRYLAPVFTEAAANIATSDPLEEMTRVKNAITEVELAINGVSKDKSIKIMFQETIKRIVDIKNGVLPAVGYSFGLTDLDEKTGGITAGINVVAGTKGGGKTSLVVNIIKANPIDKKIPLLFFSLEMKYIDILTNLIANIQTINSRSLRTGNIDHEEIDIISRIESRLEETFEIDETGGITWQYFEAKVRAFRKKHKIPYSTTLLVILDYLQLMKNTPDEARMSKEEKIEQICTELMRICKNENISLVLLSQFSRSVDSRGADKFNPKADFRPIMSDLKGSGAIEAAAVLILLLYRPEYHGIEVGKNGMSTKGLCEINIAKGRFVDPQPVYAKFMGKYSKFEDYVPDGINTSGEETF